MQKNRILIVLAVCVLAIIGVIFGSGILKAPAAQGTELKDQPTASTTQPTSTAQTASSAEPSGSAKYHKIDAAKAQKMMSEAKEFVLLDVRTSEEFAEKRIDGAMLIPDYEIEESAAAKLPDKDTLILVYCRSGRRSANASTALVNMGYTNVYDFGGINDWPYATISD